MIAPLVDEDLWIETLSRIPSWYPPGKPTLVIAPHPDDETLGAGGLIASARDRHVPVTVMAVTDGEAAYPDSVVSTSRELAVIRQSEQERALETLGVASRDIVRLRLPDSAVSAREAELEKYVAQFVTAGSLVVAPWPLDWHPDHEACGRAALRAAEGAGAEIVFYLFWTFHCKSIEALTNVPLCRLELDERLQTLKQAALHCHHSQLERDGEGPTLPDRLLDPARRSFETFIVHVQ